MKCIHELTGSPDVGVSFDGRYVSLAWPDAGEYAIYAARPDGAWTQIARSSGVAVAWAAVAASFAVLHVPRVGSSLGSCTACAQCCKRLVQQCTCMHCPWTCFLAASHCPVWLQAAASQDPKLTRRRSRGREQEVAAAAAAAVAAAAAAAAANTAVEVPRPRHCYCARSEPAAVKCEVPVATHRCGRWRARAACARWPATW